MINPEYGFGGMMTVDVGSLEKANALMELMQSKNLGYLAVSLGSTRPCLVLQDHQPQVKFLWRNKLKWG
jgi:hypothetical protein